MYLAMTRCAGDGLRNVLFGCLPAKQHAFLMVEDRSFLVDTILGQLRNMPT